MSKVLAVFILTILNFCLFVTAQAPTCLAGFQWAFNSLDQSPCAIAIALGGVCKSEFVLDPLPLGFLYIGPTVANRDPCLCSSVYYSVLSACALCQDELYLDWSVYDFNCTTVYNQVFPSPLPQSITVPHYAYLDVVSNDGFDVLEAESAGGAESTPVPQATPTSAGATGAGATATATGTSALATSPSTPTFAGGSSSSKKVNAGAIAGGVVGGVVFLAIGGLIALILLRRRKNLQTARTPSTYTPSGKADTAMAYGDITYNSVPTSMTPVKVYDPNDSSTFPANDTTGYNMYSSSPHTSHQQRATIAPSFTGNATLASIPASGAQYTGAPEL